MSIFKQNKLNQKKNVSCQEFLDSDDSKDIIEAAKVLKEKGYNASLVMAIIQGHMVSPEERKSAYNRTLDTFFSNIGVHEFGDIMKSYAAKLNLDYYQTSVQEFFEIIEKKEVENFLSKRVKSWNKNIVEKFIENASKRFPDLEKRHLEFLTL